MPEVRITIKTVEEGSQGVQKLNDRLKQTVTNAANVSAGMKNLGSSVGDAALKKSLLAQQTQVYNARVKEMAGHVMTGKMTMEAASKEANSLATQLGIGEKTTKRSTFAWMDLAAKITVAQTAFNAVAGVAQTAWKAIGEGANLNQLESSFNLLNEQVLHTPDLLKDMSAAINGTVSDAVLMQGVLKLTAGASNESAQAFANAAPQLLEISKAAQKLNPTLGDTAFLYESITTGIKRGSPMILDNLGIVIKVEEANRKYAESIGKTVAQLTSEEKTMAILNATLESGGQLINQVGGNIDAQGDSVARVEVLYQEAKNTFSQWMAVQNIGTISGITNAIDEWGNATEEGHSKMRNMLVVMAEITRVNGQSQGFDQLIAWLEATKAETASLTKAQKDLAVSTTTIIHGYSDAGDAAEMYGKAAQDSAAGSVAAWRAMQEQENTIRIYTNSLNAAGSAQDMYAQVAMDAANASVHATNVTLAAQQAQDAYNAAILQSFTTFSTNEEALAEYEKMLQGVVTTSTLVSGRTEEQNEELERLQGIYDKAAGTIRDYEQGLKGVNLEDDARNAKIAEQQQLMANAQAAMQPLLAIQGEYIAGSDGGRAATQAMNDALYTQIAAVTDDANMLALAGVATGQFSQEQADAMLKAAMLEEGIRAQAEAFAAGKVSIDEAKANIQSLIDTLNGIPAVVSTEVRTTYTQTNDPPAHVGQPTGPGGGSGLPDAMNAAGGHFIVPPGYNERTGNPFVQWLSSGEEVNVVPAGQVGNGNAGGGINVGNVTINAAPGQDGRQLFNEFMQEAGRRARLHRVGVG